MKLKKLKLDNFAQFVDFELEFDGDITRLVGVNGSGKTTIGVTAIWAGLKGIAERTKDGLVGDRFRFIGSKRASADIEITIVDETNGAEITVRNHITKASNQITFEAPEDYPISDEWLQNLLNVAFLSAKNFCAMNGREQALALGIDTSEHDAKIKSLKEDFTEINRDVRRYSDLEPVEKAERVDLQALLAKRKEIDAFNREQEGIAHEREQYQSLIDRLKSEAEELERRLKEIRERISTGTKKLAELLEPKPLKSTDEIDAAMQEADATNQQADRYRQYVEKKAEYDAAAKRLESNKEQQKKAEAEKVKYIKSFDFPFDGLTVDESGALLLNNRPIREPYFSKGEVEIIVAKLYASTNPVLKTRFIDDFELLDEDNQRKLADSLVSEGFQLITAEVGKHRDGPNVVLLRECAIVDSYDGNKKEALV